MSSRPNTKRGALSSLAIPVLLAGTLAAAFMLWESRHPLSAPTTGRMQPTRGPVDPDQGKAPGSSTTPGPAQTREKEPDPATNLLANPALIEVATTDGRYVSLTDASGLWAVSNPVRLLDPSPMSWQEGVGMPFAGRWLNLSLHRSLVRGSCVHVDVETGASFDMSLMAKGFKEKRHVEAGRGLVEATCVKAGFSGASLIVSMKPSQPLPPGARPVVKGIWITPDAGPAPSTPPARPEPCGTAGLRLEAGRTLFARALALKDDVLEIAATGAFTSRLGLSVRSTPGGTSSLLDPEAGKSLGEGGADSASWPLGITRDMPVEVEVSLPEEARGPVCIERLALRRAQPAPAAVASEIPDVDGVVLILVDTLRADAARAFNARSTVETPIMEELAGESLVFEDATAHANYTKPSVASILTGVYPHETGALSHKGVLWDETTMVTEMLEAAGVETVGLFSNRFLTSRFGFMRGWDTDVHVNAYKACVSGDIVTDAAKDLLEAWHPKGPFFLYIHLMDPHAPYDPPTSFEIKYVGHRVLEGRITPRSTSSFITNLRRGKVEPPDVKELKILKGLYRGDVASLDEVLGRVLAMLEREGILDRALLVVTSDHGEEFMEHGWLGHGTNIHPELTHIPLLLRFPGGSPSGTIEGLVGHVDLVPTILDAFGRDAPDGLDGRSLLDRITEPVHLASPPAHLLEHWNGTYGLRLGQWMLIAHRKSTSIARLKGQKVWYQDAGRNPVKWLYLRERLALLILENRKAEIAEHEVKLDEQTRSQLEALGYIMDGKDGVAGPEEISLP
ncbi:MAG: sulfatase [Deltaproteobacteria bacterium]|nr:sulfatase [Deltaproteobacteria bacterium]